MQLIVCLMLCLLIGVPIYTREKKNGLVVLNKKVRVARELLVVNNGVAPHTLNNYLIYVIWNQSY